MWLRDVVLDLTRRSAFTPVGRWQRIDARPYRGRRLGLTADLRTEEADAGAIWLRIDGSQTLGMRFDNMMKRTIDGPLKGTRSWATRSIVLDVPNDAEGVHYGFFFKGFGKVWARSFKLESVTDDISPTALNCHYLAEPNNLDFLQN